MLIYANILKVKTAFLSFFAFTRLYAFCMSGSNSLYSSSLDLFLFRSLITERAIRWLFAGLVIINYPSRP